MKLLIAIPTMDAVPVDFMKSLLGLSAELQRNDVDYHIEIEAGTLIYMARDRLARRAIKDRYTHVLWLDSDMVFPPSILEDLQFSGKDFVSGIAHSRRKPFSSCLFKNIDLNYLERWQRKDYPKSTFEVAGCGFACVLMRADILKAVIEKHDTAFMPFLHYGEDLSFCKRAAAMGFKFYAEPSAKLGHIGHLQIWPDDCERYLDDIQY